MGQAQSPNTRATIEWNQTSWRAPCGDSFEAIWISWEEYARADLCSNGLKVALILTEAPCWAYDGTAVPKLAGTGIYLVRPKA